MSFFHLSVRSAFSLLEGASRIRELCAAAVEQGLSGFALTDTNALYGLPEYVNCCEHFGLTPVVGARLDGKDGQRAVALPTSRAGYAALCRAITARHRRGAELDLAAQLAQDGQDLVVLSDHAEVLETLHGAGHDLLYVELRRRRNPVSERLAARLGLEVVASGDVVFARPEHGLRHRVLRAIATKTTLGRLDPDVLAPDDAWLQPVARLREAFWDDAGARAMALSAELAAACRFGGTDWGYGVLTFPEWKPGADATAALREATYAGARGRYRTPPGAPLPGMVQRRIERELDLVVRKGFADYFLIVRDIVQGSPRTCGRGSAAASIIAYALGITHVDPVRHDLFFERFLNEGREHPPDIDVDFPWDERDDVLARVFARFGPRAAMVCNHVRFRPRAALREVARSHGLPEHEVAAVTSRLPYTYWSSGSGEALSDTLRRHPRMRGVHLDPPWDGIVPLAQGISGLPRHLSVHPGGVVITPGPISDLVPVETAPKGVPILQWEKDGSEEAGLVKIDLLGNRSLAVIRDALAAAREHGADPPDYAELDVEDDPRCQSMLARGETMGCFYVESPAMRQLQQRSGRGDFEHLVIHSSIIRPAANAFIREYLRRLHGGPWEPLHPELERILEETLGLMAYQEDLARIAIGLAGFSAQEADKLRKVLSKKERSLKLADMYARYAEGARAHGGLSEELIASTWTMMESFAGYSFCKSHSASYALVSFKCTWLRDRFPAEFLAAVISNGGGYYSTLGYLGEARRMGLAVSPACVNHSLWAWTGRDRELRVGLGQLRGLREAAGRALVEARGETPFASFEDLVERVPRLERADLTLLARAGALDVLEPSRARLHWRVALLARRAHAGALFGEVRASCPDAPNVPDLDPEQRLEQELMAYGLPVTCHPLELWAPGIDSEQGLTPACEIPSKLGKRVRVVGWLVTAKLVQTKHREAMEFLTLEDRTGLVDVTAFPRVYARAASAIHAPRPVMVSGRVEEEFGVTAVVADRIRSWWGPCRIAEPNFAADVSGEDLLE